ncbi:MAG: GGDEF domain-containing protein, partial [Thermodesulfobacteriota bacterium]
MNKKKTEAELPQDQKQLLEELASLKQIIARQYSGEPNESGNSGGITIARTLPNLDFEAWKNLAENYGLYNWLALPLQNDEAMIPYLSQLQAKMDSLLELAEKDPLTEISNRRGLDRQLETEIERCKRLEISLSLV